MIKYFYKAISVSIVALSCLTILNLSACGKRGPLYLEEKPQDAKTEATTKTKKTEQ